MKKPAVFVFVLCLLCGTAWVQAPAQVGELQERVERGLSQLGTQIQEGWTEIRQSVDRMGLTGRVYARLHWDKALQDAALEIEAEEGQTVVLKGSVPSQAAKEKAVQLAQETVGVKRVVDRLAVLQDQAR
jgi:hyperosmotically inducible periplasmic protein